jgi:hypothetical protein
MLQALRWSVVGARSYRCQKVKLTGSAVGIPIFGPKKWGKPVEEGLDTNKPIR